MLKSRQASYYVMSRLFCDLAQAKGRTSNQVICESESNTFCDFTRLKAEDPFSYPLYYQAVTRIQETATFSYQQVNQLSASIILRSFTLNNPENIYIITLPPVQFCYLVIQQVHTIAVFISHWPTSLRIPHEQPRYPVQRSRLVTLWQDLSPNPNSVL